MEITVQKQETKTNLSNFKVKEGIKQCEIRLKTGYDCTQASCQPQDMTRVWYEDGWSTSVKFMSPYHIIDTIQKLRKDPTMFCCSALKSAWLNTFYGELRRRRRVSAKLFSYVSRNSKYKQFFESFEQEEYKAQSEELTKKLQKEFNQDLKKSFKKL